MENNQGYWDNFDNELYQKYLKAKRKWRLRNLFKFSAN